MDFHNFFTIYVFEVKEFIIDILIELRCEGPWKFKSTSGLKGTDDTVL